MRIDLRSHYKHRFAVLYDEDTFEVFYNAFLLFG